MTYGPSQALQSFLNWTDVSGYAMLLSFWLFALHFVLAENVIIQAGNSLTTPR